MTVIAPPRVAPVGKLILSTRDLEQTLFETNRLL